MSNNRKKETYIWLRWIVLFFISLAMFGNYYVYDSISPLADLLKSQLNFSDKNIGLLNGIYSFPNIIMVFIGGIIIDRIGTKKGSFLFSLLCMIGAGITTFSNGSIVVMALGRLIFGLGAESLIVAITTVLAKWFKGKELSFAFGLNLTIARLGTFSALNSPTWAKSLYSYWQYPLLVATGMSVISFLAVVIYIFIDITTRRKLNLPEERSQEKIVFKDIITFKKSFWYVTMLCVTFYSAIFPFQTFAIKMFQEHHKLSREMAGFTSSIITLASMIGTPLFGLFIDRYGKRATVMVLGSLMIVPVYLMMVYTRLHPIVMTSIMGVAFSLVPASMWPSVALIVSEEKLGTAYGLMTMCQNIGLTIFNFVVGWVNDLNTHGNITNYTPSMWLFSITGILGLIFASFLLMAEKGKESCGLEHGLIDSSRK